MQGAYFNYRPGEVTVSFRHGDFDYLELAMFLRLLTLPTKNVSLDV
jgi:hypothetical protein